VAAKHSTQQNNSYGTRFSENKEVLDDDKTELDNSQNIPTASGQVSIE
jgi:hypothetical protein